MVTKCGYFTQCNKPLSSSLLPPLQVSGRVAGGTNASITLKMLLHIRAFNVRHVCGKCAVLCSTGQLTEQSRLCVSTTWDVWTRPHMEKNTDDSLRWQRCTAAISPVRRSADRSESETRLSWAEPYGGSLLEQLSSANRGCLTLSRHFPGWTQPETVRTPGDRSEIESDLSILFSSWFNYCILSESEA